MNTVLSWLAANPGTAVTGLLSALGFVFGGMKWMTAQRKAVVASVIKHAFLCVEDLVDNDGLQGLSKEKAGLEAAEAWMEANGWAALKPTEKLVLTQGFKALNGSTVALQQAAPVAKAAPSPK